MDPETEPTPPALEPRDQPMRSDSMCLRLSRGKILKSPIAA